MFKKSLFLFTFLFLFFTAAGSSYALNIPSKASGYVHDAAGMMEARAKSQLEVELYQFEKQTGNQIVVATFPSLESENLEDFSMRLAETWKIGQKDKNNGVIFLIFKKERKMRIEVGYGLEGALPDALAGQIIQLAVAPVFRKEQYEQGISAGVKAIMQAVQGEFEAQTPAADAYENAPLTQAELEAQRKSIEAAAKLVFFLGAILLTVDLLRYGNYVRSHSRSSSRYSFAEWFLRFAFLLAVISFLFRILIYSMLFSRGGYSSGGRGGFSGGGGGSFGGGGASGRW